MDGEAPALPPEEAASPTSAWTRSRPVLGAVGALASISLVAGLMARPWIGRGKPLPVVAFTDVSQGEALLEVKHDTPGDAGTWVSVNSELVPGPETYTQLDEPWLGVVLRFAGQRGTHDVDEKLLERLVVQKRIRRGFSGSGAGGTVTDIYVLAPSGAFWVGQQLPDRDPMVFDPPVRVLPGQPHAGDRWTSRGEVTRTDGTTDRYRFDGSVTGDVTIATAYGRRTGCFRRTGRLRYASVSGQHRVLTTTTCPGLGTVEERDGYPPEDLDVYRVQSVAGQPARAIAPSPAPPEDDPADAPGVADIGQWRLEPIGRSTPRNPLVNASAPPLYVPGERPVVVVSDDSRPGVVALDPLAPGTVRWRFSTAGMVLGSSSADPERGRVYFGTSDKRVYAVDSRGVFLWATATGDNVAAPPLAAGDVVVVAGEDGVVRALDADTGRQRWSTHVGQPLAAGPARLGDRVAVAGDDGIVRLLRLHDGSAVWEHDAGAPVEAGLVTTGDDIVVATRAGTVASLDGRDGSERWSGSIDGAVRLAPTSWHGQVAVIDELGNLRSFDADTGAVRWSRAVSRGLHLASAAVLGEHLLVARDDGAIEAYRSDGRRVRTWPVSETDTRQSPAAPPPTFGLAAGGGAVWWSGNGGMLLRLGAHEGAPHLRLRWFDAGFQGPLPDAPSTGSARWRDEIVFVDEGGRLERIDGERGAVTVGRRLVEREEAGMVTGPVVAGDLLLVDRPDRLVAYHLPDGRKVWERAHGESSPQPPVVGHGTVVLTAGNPHGLGSIVSGLDAATGAVRWSRTTSSGYGPQGVTIVGDAVIGGSPLTAWDLETGEERWRTRQTYLSGVTASLDSRTVLAWSTGTSAENGQLAAFDPLTGDRRWQVDSGGVVLPYDGRVLVSATVAVVADRRHVAAFDLASGEQRWGFTLPEALASAPAVLGRALVLPLVGGAVWSVDVTRGSFLGAHQGVDAAGTPSGRLGPVQLGPHIIVTTRAGVWSLAKDPTR